MPLEAFKSVSGALAQPLSILKIGNNCVSKGDGRGAAGSARFPPMDVVVASRLDDRRGQQQQRRGWRCGSLILHAQNTMI
jgi:hypothetical protein